MPRKKKNRPSAPRKIVRSEAEIQAAAEKAEREEAEKRDARAEDRRVKDLGGVINRDKLTGKTVSREINDVAMQMRKTKDEHGCPLISDEEVGAVRKLEGLIERAYGGGGSCLSTLERVSGQSAGDPTLASVIRHTQSALDLNARRARLGPKTWAMLRELCDGNLGLPVWHSVVARHSGEANPTARGAIVRQAFRELAQVERDLHCRRSANDSAPDIALAS